MKKKFKIVDENFQVNEFEVFAEDEDEAVSLYEEARDNCSSEIFERDFGDFKVSEMKE